MKNNMPLRYVIGMVFTYAYLRLKEESHPFALAPTNHHPVAEAQPIAASAKWNKHCKPKAKFLLAQMLVSLYHTQIHTQSNKVKRKAEENTQ